MQINPMVRDQLPRTGREIINRLNEITFNSSLIKELRSIDLLHRLIDAEGVDSERYRALYVHIIHADQELKGLDASSKSNAEWAYLEHLKQRGWMWAEAFMELHYDDIGERSSFDLGSLFDDSFCPPAVGAKERGKAG